MDDEATAKFLSQQGWLSTLPARMREDWLSGAKMVKFARGEMALHALDDAEFVIGVAEGTFGAVFSHDSEQTRLVTIYGPGNWFGDAAVLTDYKRRAAAIARSDCTCLVVPAKHVHAVAKRDPELWRWIATNVTFQFDSYFTLTEAALNRDPTRRLITMILGLCQLNPRMRTFDLSTDEIGQMIGLVRNTVAKCLKELEEAGLIERKYAKLTVVSLPLLRRELTRRSAK